MLISLRFLNKVYWILILALVCTFAQNSTDTGTLSIVLNSPGHIYLDSHYLSTESINNLVLKSGEYTLSVLNSNSNKWNERGYEQIITILPNEHTNLIIDNPKTYYLNSIPYNSTVLQNNKLLGTTPLFLSSDKINLSEKIIIQKPGYIDKDVFVTPSQYEYFFSLKPESIKNEIIITSPVLDNMQASWFKEGFVFVSVISSWAAFYFKREADKNYAKYNSTTNVVKMNDYYNKTKRLDRCSDISITISIGSLATYMYFLIFE